MAMKSMRLPDDLTNQPGALATATGRSKSFLVGQTICDFIDHESWQIAEITQVISEADKGDFTTDDEVNNFSSKWQRNAGCLAEEVMRNLDAEADYIAKENKAAAAEMFLYVKAKVDALSEFHTRRKPPKVV